MFRFFLISSLFLLSACSSPRYIGIDSYELLTNSELDPQFIERFTIITSVVDNEIPVLCRQLAEQSFQTYSASFLVFTCAKRWLSLDLTDEQAAEAILLFNQSLEPLVRLALSDTHTQPINFKVRIDRSSYDYKVFDNINFSSDVRSLDAFTTTTPNDTSVGVALVGQRANNGENLDKFYPQEGVFRPLAAMPLSLDVSNPNLPVLNLELKRPHNSFWRSGSRLYPVVNDLATSYLLLAEAAKIGEYELTGLFLSDQVEDKLGIYAIEQIVPHKIPILMIHGLNSSPMIWRRLSWALSSDPKLAERYQIWHAFYPSGPPPFYSAMLLKSKLAELKSELNFPSESLVNNEMWIIGHSMGGIISRLFVVNSGMHLWDRTFSVGPDDLGLYEDDVEAFKEIFLITPERNVKGVVFIETPHKGSAISERFFARVASAIIRLPISMRELFSSIWKGGVEKFVKPEMKPYMTRTGPDSVRVLSPQHPLIQELSKLHPVVPFFSVVGNNNPATCSDVLNCPDMTDGVVEYSSAHMKNAQQEVVVHSAHNAYQSPEAIEFILEILAGSISND
ncbi:esterase/lipase family protein [Aliidiomarina soli]|uniref:Alpha/beta hydrolase n=1 Tax=Aliidiomarina soli TaxID=1928574 RepID=A0A432WJG2_9GAMM|nr:alpha/beta hydrolase [Aliidiomarina soli]RUO33819.1 hypothetical protein CWE14_04975 [Aliidiomarina soli]